LFCKQSLLAVHLSSQRIQAITKGGELHFSMKCTKLALELIITAAAACPGRHAS
jgi:hypothetical protein